MPGITIVYGILMILLGLGGYFGSAALKTGAPVSITALIPAAFGIIAVMLGLLAYRVGARKHAMHLAAMLGLLGILAPGYKLIKALIGGTFDMGKPATVALLLMLVFSVTFLLLCVRSFVLARRARLLMTAAGEF